MTESRASAALAWWLTPAVVACLSLLGCTGTPSEEAPFSAAPTTESPHSASGEPSASPSTDPGDPEEALAPIAEPRGRVLSLTDPRGDVHRRTGYDEGPMKKTPRERDGDVVNVRLVHAPARIYIRLKLARLADPGENADYAYHLFVQLNRAKGGSPMERGWTLRTGAGYRSGKTVLWRGEVGREVAYEGLIGQFDYRRDEVRINIPRNCLQDPAWVQATLWLETYRFSPRPFTTIEDFWLGPSRQETFSPRVLAP